MIIDDHPSCRASARHVLEDAGFVVIGEAQDGASGLAAATEMRPAVVLLDVQLPHFDGFDVATRLTSQRDGPAVVLTSSRDGSEFGAMVARSGARGFCTQGRAVGARAGGAARMIGLRRGLIAAGRRTTITTRIACA
ncbi:MAG: response regulator transcription factor [Solirubrobacteraceae bacterium]